MSSLSGKTLFVTGASRGIGKAIALRAARDGANVAIVAKTAEPHPKPPGTVYTADEALRPDAFGQYPRHLSLLTKLSSAPAKGRQPAHPQSLPSAEYGDKVVCTPRRLQHGEVRHEHVRIGNGRRVQRSRRRRECAVAQDRHRHGCDPHAHGARKLQGSALASMPCHAEKLLTAGYRIFPARTKSSTARHVSSTEVSSSWRCKKNTSM